MKGYKGFNKDLTCLNKQYAENTIFEEDSAEVCKNGMHFCKNPFSVLKYYGFVNNKAELNEFCEIEALDNPVTDYNEKYCSKKLKIGAKIGIPGLTKAFVEFTLNKTEKSETNTGYRSASTNTGYRSSSTNTGEYSASTNTGECSASTNTGYRSASTNKGNYSASTNTGNYSASTNTGKYSASTNTGNHSASTNTGDRSASTNTGDFSASTVEGKNSFAIATGIESKARGALGCYIAVAEWKQDNSIDWKLVNFRSHKVDGKTIKPNVFYTLKNGRFVEVK